MLEASDPALEVQCPECGAVERDDFEVIGLRALCQLRCWSCQTNFGVWLEECRFCGEEVLVPLPDGEDDPASYLPSRCPGCHAKEAFHENAPSDCESLAQR